MTVTIRQATPEDLSSIVGHYGPGDTPWDPFGNLGKLQEIPLEGLIIAEVDSEYAGFLYWFVGENPWFDPDVQKYAYITEIHVLEKYQGQGVGKKLLNYAIGQLKKETNMIYITTTEDNAVARHLYENAGFCKFSRSIHYRLERVDRTKPRNE